jgi:hypothetical protein
MRAFGDQHVQRGIWGRGAVIFKEAHGSKARVVIGHVRSLLPAGITKHKEGDRSMIMRVQNSTAGGRVTRELEG